MGFVQNTMETGFKRKRKVPQFYGYDPSIQTLPGDPRLNPPPSWFGVNFHPSQPVNNAWRDWAGEEYPLFDISQNKAVPLSRDSAVVQDSHRRKKQKELMVLVPKQLMSMVLHSPQPVHNSWSDWNDGKLQKISLPNFKNGISLHSIRQRVSHHHCCSEPDDGSERTVPSDHMMDTETESKVRTLPAQELRRIPMTNTAASSANSQHAKATGANGSSRGSVVNAVRKPAQQASTATSLTSSATVKSGAFVYKDRAQKRAAADKRNKYVQLVLRIKKQLYVKALEERVAHLEELKRSTWKRTGEAKTHESGVNNMDWALNGNGTFDVASHGSCSHAKTDPWEVIKSKLDGRKQGSQPLDDAADSPELWEKHFVETLAQVDSIRLQLLLDRGKDEKVSAISVDMKGILRSLREMIAFCLAQKRVMEAVIAVHNGRVDAHSTDGLGRSLPEALGIQEAQLASIVTLYESRKGELERTVLQLQITGRALSFIWKAYMNDRLRCDADRFNELLTSKQVKKVLNRVAKWRGELGDRMNEVLRNMGNLSIE